VKSSCPLWLTSSSTSVVLLVEQRLNVLGEMIAHPLNKINRAFGDYVPVTRTLESTYRLIVPFWN
jgi:hypothetical protein